MTDVEFLDALAQRTVRSITVFVTQEELTRLDKLVGMRLKSVVTTQDHAFAIGSGLMTLSVRIARQNLVKDMKKRVLG